jgi:hypothetical protein
MGSSCKNHEGLSKQPAKLTDFQHPMQPNLHQFESSDSETVININIFGWLKNNSVTT